MKLKAIFLSGIISALILSANVYADEITVDMTTTATTYSTVDLTEPIAVIHGSSDSVLTVDFMENSNTDDASSETTDTDVTEKSDGKKSIWSIWSNILLIVIAIVLFGVLAFVWEYFILPWWSHK